MLLHVAEALAGMVEEGWRMKTLERTSESGRTRDTGLEAGGGRNGEVDLGRQDWEQDGLVATGKDDGSEVPLPLRGEEEKESSWSNFKEVFMVSALTGDGVDELRVCFMPALVTSHH